MFANAEDPPAAKTAGGMAWMRLSRWCILSSSVAVRLLENCNVSHRYICDSGTHCYPKPRMNRLRPAEIMPETDDSTPRFRPSLAFTLKLYSERTKEISRRCKCTWTLFENFTPTIKSKTGHKLSCWSGRSVAQSSKRSKHDAASASTQASEFSAGWCTRLHIACYSCAMCKPTRVEGPSTMPLNAT